MSNLTWNLESIYPSMDAPAFRADMEELSSVAESLKKQIEELDARKAAERLPEILGAFNRLSDLSEHLESYIYAKWSSDTSDARAQKELNNLEARSLAVKDVFTRFRAAAADFDDSVFESGELEPYRFWLEEQRFLASREMSPAEEALAADLQRCGGDAWDRLHDKLASSLARPWGDGEKTVNELIALSCHPETDVRRRAWKEETAAFRSAQDSFAAALNGVKGTSVILDIRRGWDSVLEKSLAQNRLSRTALDAMLEVMDESLPLFRRYFKAKASMMGLDKLSWYDRFAPLGDSVRSWSWEETARFIPERFDELSPRMGDFARRAFNERWLDPWPRGGKVGGAYCIHLPLSRASRILCNFDGSFDSVSTVAHELGHAFHGEVIQDLPGLKREYPMTLAETASIFSETLVFKSALKSAESGEKAALMDTYLIGASQVIVDILSRFRFESAVMDGRVSGEFSADELCGLMLDAQEYTYGDALHPDERHAWMWAVKGHYYSPDLAFYNYPYAFGQLFASGLYSLYEEQGTDFAGTYETILRLTGAADAVSVARRAGFDIETPEFWRRGIASAAAVIEEFEGLLSQAAD